MSSHARHCRRMALATVVALTLAGSVDPAAGFHRGTTSALAADAGIAATPSTCSRLGPVTGWTGHITFSYDYTLSKPSSANGTVTIKYHRTASYNVNLGSVQKSAGLFKYYSNDTAFHGVANADDRTDYIDPSSSSWERMQTTNASTFSTFGFSGLNIDTTACTYGFSSGVMAENVLTTTSSGGRDTDDLLVGYITLPQSEIHIGKTLELSGHEVIPESSAGIRGFMVGYPPPENSGTATISWSFEPIGVCPGELSGLAWVPRFPDSKSTADLAQPFRDHVTNFLSALGTAHAGVSIGTTYRPRERGYIMHYAYDIANHLIDPAKVPPYPGVHVCWVHEDLTASRAAATQMMHAYHIVYRPAWPVSRHFDHLAIDMTITWTGPLVIKDASGNIVHITSAPQTGAGNTDLWAVGKSYGVNKLQSDPPHWSSDGH